MIYLDNAATTFPKSEEVYQAMDKINRNAAVNAGRGSYKLAREVSILVNDTKQMLRNMVNANSNVDVVFSPSITIALNQVIFGIKFRENANIYVSPYEHNAVARTLSLLSEQKSINVRLLPVKKEDLSIDIESMKYMFSKEKPDAVFCTHISNVTGYILPIKEIFAEAKYYNALTVLDSAQSMGLIDININSLNVDIIAFAGHKSLYGPFGVGGFINVSRVPLDVVIAGGTGSDSLNLNMPLDGEIRFEASSSNIIAIAGLNAALKEIDISKIYEHEMELTKLLVEKLNEIRGVKLYIPSSNCHVGIVSFSISGMMAEDVGTILDEDFDIAVRTGYHCAPYIHELLKDEKSLGTVRVGIGRYNTKEDIIALVDAIEEICEG